MPNPLLILSFLALAVAPPEGVDGLWAYRSIARQGGPEASIEGLFLFREGRFAQQSLNSGEPFDRQLAQAHSGSYQASLAGLSLISEVGLVVDPSQEPPVESRRDVTHRVVPRRSGDTLTLTFGTGTVQKLAWLGPGKGQFFLLDRGALALVGGGHFLLVAETSETSVAGSGTFEERNGRLVLRAERWFSIQGGRPTYLRDRVLEAALDGERLELPGGIVLRIMK